ncbi:MAG: hypothetical protein QM539_04470 [Alphaproteobacteria bacterium]|nr:hypothetical protein [Alphaproteobacteria bacterium]
MNTKFNYQHFKNRYIKLFYPFLKEIKIGCFTENDENYNKFLNEFNSVFINNSSYLNLFDNIKYFKENNKFNIKIEDNTIIKFDFINLPFLELENKYIFNKADFDFIIVLINFNDYLPPQYDFSLDNTYLILDRCLKFKLPFIILNLNIEKTIKIEINDLESWVELNNNLFNLVKHFNFNFQDILTDFGKNKFRGLNLLYCRLKIDYLFNISRKINFFYNTKNNITFGYDEFMGNLIINLLNFDKLNDYNYKFYE